jgi:hypothetical protein
MTTPIPIMILGLALINVVGLWFANYFRLLIFLDTLATAVAGVYFGVHQPWGAASGVIAGALVGLATNLVTGWKYPVYLRFAHVNVLCGIAWGLLPIVNPLPPSSATETAVLIYILQSGLIVGLISALAAVPVRIFVTKFHSDHLLDQVSGAIWADQSRDRGSRFLKILTVEYLLSHGLERVLATTLAVIYVFPSDPAPISAVPVETIFRSLMELLAAYYFVALAVAVQSLGATLKDPLLLLLGPLGFFSVFMAAPGVLRLVS